MTCERKPPVSTDEPQTQDKAYFQSSKAATMALAGHAWVPHTVKLCTSIACQALDRDAFLAVTRLEIEHMRHAGKENGQLKVTYDQFEQTGIQRKGIRRTLDWLCALGLLAVTHRGTFAVGGDNANEYRLTYLPWKFQQAVGAPQYLQPTNEWKTVKHIPKKPAKPHPKKRVSKYPRVPPHKYPRVPLSLVRDSRDSDT
jgi:hypothetical protein